MPQVDINLFYRHDDLELKKKRERARKLKEEVKAYIEGKKTFIEQIRQRREEKKLSEVQLSIRSNQDPQDIAAE